MSDMSARMSKSSAVLAAIAVALLMTVSAQSALAQSSTPAADKSILDQIWDWTNQSSKEYQDVLRRIAQPGGTPAPQPGGSLRSPIDRTQQVLGLVRHRNGE